MIVVIPVCHKDVAIAIRNIEHAFMLDGAVDFQAIIAHERGWDSAAVTEAAECYFKGVSHIVYEPWKGDTQWPQIQNWAFQSVAREMVALKQPWFWWEADATPVRAGWLHALRDAYKSGKRPFAGPVTQLNGLHYMAGVAIYPANAPERMPHALFARIEAFDVVAGVRDGILRQTHDISSLIAHTPSVNNTHFNNQADVEKYVSEGAVLFHKCKDGSLLDVLQGRTPSDEVINPADNAPSFCEQTPWPCGYFAFPTATNTVNFNCSIAKVGDSLHLFTRRQRFNIEVRGRAQKQNKSDLAIWKVRPNMTLEPNVILPSVPQRYPMEQWEDPRAMVGADGRIYLGMATWVHYKNWSIRQSFARLTHDWRTLEPLFEAPYGGNTRVPATGRTNEKNWIWFEHDGQWVCQYAINPGEFFAVDGKGNVTQSWKSPEVNVAWNHGLPLRGGTPLTRVGDELIGFFHTSTVWNKPKRRYFMGAYALEGKPPFRLRRMTAEPLLIGSEHDFRALGGPLVIFPNGALLEGDDWLVTFGVNDEACGWIKIPHKELQSLSKAI